MAWKPVDRISWMALGSALLASAGLKTWLVAAGWIPFNADEAIVALMARHILQGERPVFFYGQAYMGSLDAWLAAGAFALFGEAVWVLRLVQGLLYLLVLITAVFLGRAALGSWRVGVAAAWLLAIPAVNVSLYTTASLGGYGEALLIGNLVLICTLHIARNLRAGSDPVGWLWLAWGGLAGVGLWAFGLTLIYSLPAGLWLAVLLVGSLIGKIRRNPTGRIRLAARTLLSPFLLIALGTLLGAAPWWDYARVHGLVPLLGELAGGNIAGVERLAPLSGAAQHLVSLILLGGSVTFGLRPPWEVRWLALPLLPLALAFWFGVLLSLARMLLGLRSILDRQVKEFSPRSGAAGLRADGIVLLSGVMLTLCLGFVLTPFGADPSGRYFLPLAVPLALFASDSIRSLRERVGRPAWALLALVLAYHLWGTVEAARRFPPGLTTQFNPVTQLDPRAQDALVAFLKANGERRGYTNYWVAYPLAFLSREELIFVPRLPYHLDFRYTPRDDRYPPYAEQAEASDRVAYITSRHPALDARLRQLFVDSGATWEENQIGDYHIFYHLSKPVRPEDGLDRTAAGRVGEWDP